jgi:hypothetical protein
MVAVIRPVSQSFLDELAQSGFRWGVRAKEAGYGPADVAVFQAEMLGRLGGWVQSARVRRRMDEPALIGVLKSGCFQPLAATGTSSSSITDAAKRADDELKIFGIELNAPPSDRPIYGYLEGSNESGALASQYGPIVVMLDEGVRARATFLLGDSHDANAGVTVCAPVPLLTPSIEAFSNFKRNLFEARTLAEACADGYGYAEVQIHGGLCANEIARIVYTRGTRPSAEAARFLEERWLIPEWTAGDDPDEA